jgi:Icc-related predicted phosphoesterase
MSEELSVHGPTTPPEPSRSVERPLRIAAVGDFHCGGHVEEDDLSRLIGEASDAADVLALVGDLTTHGEPGQVEEVGRMLATLDMPIVTVLGNHDCESGNPRRVAEILESYGVTVLDGDAVVVDGVGFAGVKGFGGGFGAHALATFGEAESKAFVQAAIDEELKLERALTDLHTEIKVVLLHYSPIPETMGDEPPQIWPFLGSSRLLPPIEDHRVSAVFHGHCHLGAPQAATPSGIPVFNVALPVLTKAGMRFRVWEAAAAVAAAQ